MTRLLAARSIDFWKIGSPMGEPCLTAGKGVALRATTILTQGAAASFVVLGITLTFERLQALWGERLQLLDLGLILLYLIGALAPVAFLRRSGNLSCDDAGT